MYPDVQSDPPISQHDGDTPEFPADPAPFITSRRFHFEMMALAVFVITASCALVVRDDQRVAVGGKSSLFVLPPLCASQFLLNVDCPGCGLTRSFVHLAHGNWEASWKVHRVGWLLASIALLQIPLRLWALYRWPTQLYSPVWGSRLIWCVIALLMLNWILKLAVG